MFSLMEVVEQLRLSSNMQPDFNYSIVPTVLLPLAFISTGISILATFIAGLFGVKLKAEGPKKLLELLLKPRILISAMVLNAIIYGGYEGYIYLKNGPVPLFIQELLNRDTKLILAAKSSGGAAKWEQDLSEGIFAAGTIVDGELFVGTKEGNLFVLDAKSGAVKNKIYFGQFLSPTPVLFKGFLYFGEGLHVSHHMRVYKFDPRIKKVVGSFQTKGHTEIFPVLKTIAGRDYLYQAAGGDGIYAIDPHTMQEIWHFDGGHMDAFALVDLEDGRDDLYIATGVPTEDIGKARPYAYQLSATTGKLKWKKELPLSSWYGPMLSGQRVCFIQGELHVKSQLGGINCMSKNGLPVSSLRIESPVIGKPIVFGDDIIFNDFDGRVYSWNSHLSKLNWKYAGREEKLNYNYSSIKYNGKELIFVDRKGKVSHLHKDSGKLIKDFLVSEDAQVFADTLLLESGYFIFGMDGIIRFYSYDS